MIKLAVIGAGHWGPNLIRNFHDNQLSQVCRVVDMNPERLDQVRARFPNVQVGAQASEAFQDNTLDAVIIATPTTTHYEMARRALEHGKHVFVEKPISTDSQSAFELCRIAEERKLVLMVGHVFIYNSAIRRIKQYIEEGDLGRIYYISMIRTNLGPIRMDVNAAWDLASHDISIVNYWLDGGPTNAWAIGGNWINDGIEDAVFGTLRYPNDVLVNLHASWLNPRKARDITVVGDKRMLTFNDLSIDEPIRIFDKQVTDKRIKPEFIDSIGSFRASVRDGDITIPRVTLAEPLKAECQHFLDCIKTNNRPATDGKFGCGVVRILEAMERSMKNHGREERVVS